ncbi:MULTISPECIES: hypothetical protein [unclassified Moorena]|uniref:hypothetical protein n=1 Tax=unclassified Moorena TaxID=2683338 RepID=UPI0013FF8804|nr:MULTISPECIES: hypothetical protein [unclassified Moorena]NEO16292.1 hypothetical protein [Moorena sp. SIO3E8]NEQ02830.1 hypothetical protein [Moorena sp. SIO3F7]
MAVEQPDKEFEDWAKQCKLGNLNSPITGQLYKNRSLTVQEYIARFRRANINQVLPDEAKTMTVEEALKAGRVAGINIRKLLTDNREKFKK